MTVRGLYGITADRLGLEGVTSARNARLVTICQHAERLGQHLAGASSPIGIN